MPSVTAPGGNAEAAEAAQELATYMIGLSEMTLSSLKPGIVPPLLLVLLAHFLVPEVGFELV